MIGNGICYYLSFDTPAFSADGRDSLVVSKRLRAERQKFSSKIDIQYGGFGSLEPML